MSIAIVTGSSGLIGSETARFLHGHGMEVVGVDNNMREYFFGKDASTVWNTDLLKRSLKNYTHVSIDIRDRDSIEKIFRDRSDAISLIVHTAAQPSHDWAAREPFTDFTVNANGTLVLLEAARKFCPEAVFIFTSTNKVYGDRPNELPIVECPSRWEIESTHHYFSHGIDEQMAIDQSKHSLFGASKLAADILVQEYGRYFDLRTGIFRGGCLTGPAHSGTELHGFLAYLVKCAVTGRTYTIHGYKGKQVRDNIHSRDLVEAFWQFFRNPQPGAVYNMGGSRHSNCSVLEAKALIEEICGKPLRYELSEQARNGDHVWWISDVRKFQRDFPAWSYQYDLKRILREMVEAMQEKVTGPAT
jgi:CDP-paratose 2-epimerase